MKFKKLENPVADFDQVDRVVAEMMIHGANDVVEQYSIHETICDLVDATLDYARYQHAVDNGFSRSNDGLDAVEGARRNRAQVMLIAAYLVMHEHSMVEAAMEEEE